MGVGHHMDTVAERPKAPDSRPGGATRVGSNPAAVTRASCRRWRQPSYTHVGHWPSHAGAPSNGHRRDGEHLAERPAWLRTAPIWQAMAGAQAHVLVKWPSGSEKPL